MKKMKKAIVLAQALLLAASMTLAGCKERVSNDAGTLQIYVANFGYGYEWLEELKKEFVKQPWVLEKYPTITEDNLVIERIRSGAMRSTASCRVRATPLTCSFR